MIGALRVECLTNRNNEILDNIAAICLNLDVRSKFRCSEQITKEYGSDKGMFQ